VRERRKQDHDGRDSSRRQRDAERRREARRRVLEFARDVAKRYAATPVTPVTLDDVMARIELFGHAPDVLGTAAGAVFRDGAFERTRCVVRSRRRGSGGRFLVVWRRRLPRRRLGRVVERDRASQRTSIVLR